MKIKDGGRCKNIKIKLKDMERHDVPSFPLDIVVFYLILSHTPNSKTLSTLYHYNIYSF